MPAERRRGMDHGLYPFSPIGARPVLRWPGGARLALWPVVHLDYWEIDPPADAVRAPDVQGAWPVIFPDYRTFSHREYGSRIGIFRVIEVLDRHGLRATMAANAAAGERCRYVIDACRERGWEFAAHGTHATRILSSRMSEADERGAIAQSIDTIERVTGQRPRGWIGQDGGESERTPALVAEAGLDYIGDWPNDDQPYRMTVGRPLVSLPYQPEWDDLQLLWLRQVATPRYPGILRDAFERLYAEGAASGRLLSINIHPWLLGQANRIRYLDEALAAIVREPGVWAATGAEIVDAFVAQERQ